MDILLVLVDILLVELLLVLVDILLVELLLVLVDILPVDNQVDNRVELLLVDNHKELEHHHRVEVHNFEVDMEQSIHHHKN
jgi:hypothetical protein